jgi:NADP-dependent 3-hydroxy acid dehydrogenase YdfG
MSASIGKVVLITGASSGIGEATARRLAAHGARVVIGARRTERLQSIAADIDQARGIVRYRSLDVTDRADMEAFVAYAESEFGVVDVLVNNAGVMPLSQLSAIKVDEWNWMIDVNIRGVLHGIAAVLPRMQERGWGHIVNVSSTAGFAVVPTAAVYAATKFAVRAISEGLRKENANVRCTCVYPGVVTSELASTISDPVARERMESHRKVAISPDAIGRAIQFAIEQPNDVDVNEIVVRPTPTLV